jgi:hypothetical protein
MLLTFDGVLSLLLLFDELTVYASAGEYRTPLELLLRIMLISALILSNVDGVEVAVVAAGVNGVSCMMTTVEKEESPDFDDDVSDPFFDDVVVVEGADALSKEEESRLAKQNDQWSPQLCLFFFPFG